MEAAIEEAAIEEAGFETMETYIWQRQNTAAQYIATRPILDLYKAAERKRGNEWEFGGGNRSDLTWRGKERRRKWTRMVWRSKGGGFKWKTPGAGATETGKK